MGLNRTSIQFLVHYMGISILFYFIWQLHNISRVSVALFTPLHLTLTALVTSYFAPPATKKWGLHINTAIIIIRGHPSNLPGRACAPYTVPGLKFLLQQPGFDSNLWPPQLHVHPSFPPIFPVCHQLHCQIKVRKPPIMLVFLVFLHCGIVKQDISVLLLSLYGKEE